MSRHEFWTYIEQCRQHSDDMPSFNRLLEAMLDPWTLPTVAAFHKAMWFDIGVYHVGGELWELVRENADYLGSDSMWDSYGGWLIAQGRAFHESVMREPRVALTRIPPPEDVWEGETVIFVAERVCRKKTDDKWGLDELFGYDMSGKPLPGVDFPVNW